MIEMWNLELTNSFCKVTLLKALVSSLSVHFHLQISCFRAMWEMILVFFLPKTSFIFYSGRQWCGTATTEWDSFIKHFTPVRMC